MLCNLRVKHVSSKVTISSIIIFLLLFSWINFEAKAIAKDRILDKNFYFHRELSGIGSYRTLNLQKPTDSDSNRIIKDVPVGVWEVGDGWISPQVPIDITLERACNFFFSVWGAGNGNATLFFKFYAYRNGNEHFLFTSNPSEQLIKNAAELLWQHKTKEVTLQIKQGDMLVIKLFINVTVAGTFGLGYDCTQYPSYVNDPTETRYMRNDNTLQTTQGTTFATHNLAGYSGNVYVPQYFQIEVYKLSGETETLLATSNIGSGSSSGLIDFTGDIPETAMLVTDKIRIKVYIDDFSPPTTLRETFTTGELNALQMDEATWTFYCYLLRIYTSRPVEVTNYRFYFGTSTYNSRIENFVWTSAVVGYALNLRVMDWDLTDAISGATVTMNNGTSNVKTSNGNGWANYTSVSGSVTVFVVYYGKAVNGTSITVSADTTKNLKCKLYDVNVKVMADSQAVLYGANVTVYNSTTVQNNKIRTGFTNQTGYAHLVNLPNNTLTFTVYDCLGVSSHILINTTCSITSDEQSQTITITQNYSSVKLPTIYIFAYTSVIVLNHKKKKGVNKKIGKC